MSILSLIIILVLVGVGLYLINSVIPMDATVKKVINIVVIVAVCLYAVSLFFGGHGGLAGGVSVPRLN